MKAGIYRGTLTLNKNANVYLPFNFEIKSTKGKTSMVLHNAEERLETTDISYQGDSIIIRSSVFDSEFRCKKTKTGLEGVWVNHYRASDNVIPFKAEFGLSYRFSDFKPTPNSPVFEGNWACTFSPGQKSETKALGVFRHIEQTDEVYGTFLTETGDYRYLEGLRQENTLSLSAFDGSHAFLFIASLSNNQLNGVFYSGTHFKEDWIGVRDNNFKLRDAEDITIVKKPDLPVKFAFPDLNGKMVSPEDARFKNKPMLIQLMGSWCPNCMDESAYLSALYQKYNPQGLEIIALAFEKTTDPEKAKQQVLKLVNRFNIAYPVLLTLQTGKDKASETFSNLSQISAFPTTIFLNRQHQVVKVHSGFSGPATGEAYTQFKLRTENLIQSLLSE